MDEILLLCRQHRIVVSGSVALKLYGMLPHREPCDVDIVFTSKEDMQDTCDLLGWSYLESSIGPMQSSYIENYFSVTVPELASTKVDAFIKPDIQIVTIYSYQLEYYRTIVQAKLTILFDRIHMNISDPVYCKHREDLDYILPKLPIPERSE